MYDIKSENPIHNTELNSQQTRIMARKRVYTVWIVSKEDDTWMMYHCPDCRNPIAQYKGDLVAEVPGEAPMPYPVQIQCKNKKCGRKIVFSEATEQVMI